jgi:hypothetical protein
LHCLIICQLIEYMTFDSLECLYHNFFFDFRVEDEKLVSTLFYIYRFSLFIREIYGLKSDFRENVEHQQEPGASML